MSIRTALCRDDETGLAVGQRHDAHADVVEPLDEGVIAGIVAAYASRQPVAAPDLPELMRQVHNGLLALQEPAAAVGISTAAEPAIESPTPVQIRTSIRVEALISFIDDKPYKASKRHLTHAG